MKRWPIRLPTVLASVAVTLVSVELTFRALNMFGPRERLRGDLYEADWNIAYRGRPSVSTAYRYLRTARTTRSVRARPPLLPGMENSALDRRRADWMAEWAERHAVP